MYFSCFSFFSGFRCLPRGVREKATIFHLGRVATQDEIQAWDIDVAPDGEGLPVGRGTVQEGARVYAERCASCHGATGVEGPNPKLVGGQGALASAHPLKTVGSYWPYATTLFDYIYRAMPFVAPQSLTPDQVYAVTAWILFQNGLLEKDAVLDRETIPEVRMLNRDGFVPDPRPDVNRSSSHTTTASSLGEIDFPPRVLRRPDNRFFGGCYYYTTLNTTTPKWPSNGRRNLTLILRWPTGERP